MKGIFYEEGAELMKKDVIFRKVYSEFTDEHDKDDIYTLSFNNNSTYKGEFKIENLAIFYVLTVYCDIKNGEFVFNEVYIQNAYDEEYRKRPVDLDKIPYYAEDLNDFISDFINQLNEL